jgi:hypothetical protein
MILIAGKPYPTVAEAAVHFAVSAKTVNSWIQKRIIPSPPVVDYGARRVAIFPPEYLVAAGEALDTYRNTKRPVA